MLEDDIVATMKRMVASTSNPRSNSGGKGKRGRSDRDINDERDEGALVYTSRHQGATSPKD